MPNAVTLEAMAPGLWQGVERATRAPEGRCHALAHLIDVPALRAYRRQRSDAAGGVDGVTKAAYGRPWRQPSRSWPIRLKESGTALSPCDGSPSPRAQGKTRPIGISACEDKWSTTPCARCSQPSTSRTFWSARMDSGLDAAPTTPLVRRAGGEGRGAVELLQTLGPCRDGLDRTGTTRGQSVVDHVL